MVRRAVQQALGSRGSTLGGSTAVNRAISPSRRVSPSPQKSPSARQIAISSGPVTLAAAASVSAMVVQFQTTGGVDQTTADQGQAIAIALLGAAFLVVTGWGLVIRERGLLALSLVGAPAVAAVLLSGNHSHTKVPVMLIAAVPAVLGIATLTRIDRSKTQRSTYAVAWMTMFASIVLTTQVDTAEMATATGLILILMLAILTLSMATQRQIRSTDLGLVAAAAAFTLPLIMASLANTAVGPSMTLNIGGSLVATALVLAAFERAREQSTAQLLKVEAIGLTVRSEVARREARERAERERTHEARSSLVALQAAVSTLEGRRELLSKDKLDSLVSALGIELERLRTLVDPKDSRSGATRFNLRQALEPSVTLQRAAGRDVHLRIPNDIVVVGRPEETIEVVQNLLDNALKYAAGSPVVISYRLIDDTVHLLIEDRGPGLDSRSEDIFTEGFQGDSSTQGNGLGLAVSRRLMQEQGGDLWFERRPSAGARFVVKMRCTADRYQS
jgi:signal transduction histidine kinase